MMTIVRKTLALSGLATLLQLSMLPTANAETEKFSLIVTEPGMTMTCPASIDILTATARTSVTGLDVLFYDEIGLNAVFSEPGSLFVATNNTLPVNFPEGATLKFEETRVDPRSGLYVMASTHTFVIDDNNSDVFMTRFLAGVP